MEKRVWRKGFEEKKFEKRCFKKRDLKKEFEEGFLLSVFALLQVYLLVFQSGSAFVSDHDRFWLMR